MGLQVAYLYLQYSSIQEFWVSPFYQVLQITHPFWVIKKIPSMKYHWPVYNLCKSIRDWGSSKKKGGERSFRLAVFDLSCLNRLLKSPSFWIHCYKYFLIWIGLERSRSDGLLERFLSLYSGYVGCHPLLWILLSMVLNISVIHQARTGRYLFYC